MSNTLKTQLLMATAMIAAPVTPAFAQALQYPAAELHGMGASSIAVALPREMNCFGPSTGPNKVGDSNGSAQNLSSEGKYDPAAGAGFNCVTQHIQPDIGGKYISTGSGAGRTAWRNLSTIAALPGTGATNKFPTDFGASAAAWPNPHFIFTDSPMATTDISTYATNAAAKSAGALIQVPFYVLPVAVAYNPVYGRKAGVDAVFNVANPVKGYDGTTVAGGLRLTKQVYCSIFNGYITNWNDVRIQALNVAPKAKVSTSLRDPVNDTAARWAADGAPIRLVGRLDNSGTTDIFTRHLAAACGGGIMGLSKPNLYLNNAQALPYNVSSGVNLSTSGSYKTSLTASPSTTWAGTTNMISGAVFTIGSGITGTEAPGKYLVANLNDGVAAAIESAPDVPSASDVDFLLNGKVGYVGADYVRPALSQTLHSAALEVGNSSQTKKPAFAMPTAANATAAFGTQIVPPESNKAGKYIPGGLFSRSNPADWYEALYSGASTLANAPVGYPITGTTQFVTGTCFASPAVRNALVAFLTGSLGKLTAAATAAPDKKTLGLMFTGTSVKALGIKPQMGIAPLPKAWSTALYETFLTRSTQKAPDKSLLVSRNLYIQAGVPTAKVLGQKGTKTVLVEADLPTTVSTTVKGKAVFNEAGPNSTCTNGVGI
ncbi:substrate-binding domain-containing protein [Novosphingobium sp. PASSN1]|uniref:substrate-binding domain-containing protein n=1 Tax=Novosphingobium sp. PASSN1 TaxID=2015561 RepID=UPI000BC8F226|nr:substrate-binding domain-containing protein [Novosphingobium sp. PASSN1]OYU36049.1 MAG: hypothetical protein CFE35_07225 [Novosphingobium sp. PASSN1]